MHNVKHCYTWLCGKISSFNKLPSTDMEGHWFSVRLVLRFCKYHQIKGIDHIGSLKDETHLSHNKLKKKMCIRQDHNIWCITWNSLVDCILATLLCCILEGMFIDFCFFLWRIFLKFLRTWMMDDKGSKIELSIDATSSKLPAFSSFILVLLVTPLTWCGLAIPACYQDWKMTLNLL